MLVEAVSGLYMASCTVFVLSYVPQILAVLRCRDGAQSTSLLTWALWTVSSAIAVAYGLFVVHRTPFTVVNIASLVCCSTIWGVAAFKRRQAATVRLPAA